MHDIVALFDHKNLAASASKPTDVLTSWLSRISPAQHKSVTDVEIRAYGGWYDGTSYSEERAKALVYYQRNLPSLFAIERRTYRVHLRFAEMLVPIGALPSSLTFTHTSALRPSELVSVVRTTGPVCQITSCKIIDVRRWISRRKACLEHGCPHDYSTFFERREQKQVDIHLASDFLLLSPVAREIALVSGDNDFVPALIAASGVRKDGLTWIRPVGAASYADNHLIKQGIKILNT